MTTIKSTTYTAVKGVSITLLSLMAISACGAFLAAGLLASFYPLHPYDVLYFRDLASAALPTDHRGATADPAASTSTYTNRSNPVHVKLAFAARCGYALGGVLLVLPTAHAMIFYVYPWLAANRGLKQAPRSAALMGPRRTLCLMLCYTILTVASLATVLALGGVAFTTLRSHDLGAATAHVENLWESFFLFVWQQSRTDGERAALYDEVCTLQLQAKCSGGRQRCGVPPLDGDNGNAHAEANRRVGSGVNSGMDRIVTPPLETYRYCPRCSSESTQQVIASFPKTCSEVLAVPVSAYAAAFLAAAIVGSVVGVAALLVGLVAHIKCNDQPGLSLGGMVTAAESTAIGGKPSHKDSPTKLAETGFAEASSNTSYAGNEMPPSFAAPYHVRSLSGSQLVRMQKNAYAQCYMNYDGVAATGEETSDLIERCEGSASSPAPSHHYDGRHAHATLSRHPSRPLVGDCRSTTWSSDYSPLTALGDGASVSLASRDVANPPYP